MGNTQNDPPVKDNKPRPRGPYDRNDKGPLDGILDDLADGIFGKRG